MKLPRILRVLRSPRTVVSAMILGVATGLWLPGQASAIGPLADIFLSLFKMCALPIVVAAIVTSVAKLVRTGESANLLGRILAVYASFTVVAGIIGALSGLAIARFAFKSEDSVYGLSALIGSKQIGLESQVAPSSSWIDFINLLVPSNVFRSLGDGHLIPCLFFFVLFGLALGRNRTEAGRALLGSFQAINDALFRMIDWFLYVLPFGMFSIFARTFAKFGSDGVQVLIRLVLSCYGALALLAAFHVVTLGFLYRRKTGQALASLKEPILVSLSTSSSLAGLPSALNAASTQLGVRKWVADLVLPLGVTLGPQGGVLFYATMMTFTATIYGLTKSPLTCLLIVLGSAMQAICGAGLPAIANMATLAVIFRPMGIPTETAVILILAIVPLLDPILSMMNLAGFCVSTAVISRVSLHSVEAYDSENFEAVASELVI